jgi:hypothetical protein
MFNLVMETNPSRRLYESLGFEVIGSIPTSMATRARSSTGANLRRSRLAKAPLSSRQASSSLVSLASPGHPSLTKR